MDTRPTLYLDCDGVVNNVYTFQAKPPPIEAGWSWLSVYRTEPSCVEVLRKIVEENDLAVVISSSWRIVHDREPFDYRFGPWLTDRFRDPWRTPKTNGLRGDDIREYQKQNGLEGEVHIILDDDTDFHPGQPLIKTNMRTGLVDDDAEAVRRRLKRQIDQRK